MNIKNILKKLKKRKKMVVPEEIIMVDSYEQLRRYHGKNVKLDLSKLPKSTDRKNIQGLDLQNLDREINLRKIYIPYRREEVFIYHKTNLDDAFLHLNHTNLKGNKVIGNLSFFHDDKLGNVYFWYNENTFDEAYKEQYPEYFLDKNAPQELKDKYYNPKIKDVIKRKVSETEKEKDDFLERQSLTFKEYIKYYEFLRGKYLGNFKIDRIERAKIAFVDYYGIKKSMKLLEKLSSIDIPLNALLEILRNKGVEEWTGLIPEDMFIDSQEEIEIARLKRIKKNK